MKNQLSKGMAIVFATNVINLVFNIITSFALPTFLSVETYAAIRTYQMYVGYIGILHLGYLDGVYLQYGGESIKRISRAEMGVHHDTLLLFQLIVSLCGAIPAVVLRNQELIALCLTIASINMTQYYKTIYQATGEFAPYGAIMNLTTISIFIVNMTLLFIMRAQQVVGYLIGYVALYMLIWGIAEVQFVRHNGKLEHRGVSLADLLANIKRGVLLMLGNFSSIILTGIDRWFVKFLLDTAAFAHYSFSVSLEGMLNVVITPISTTLYNYFCVNDDSEGIRRIRNYVMLFAVVAISSAFPAKVIVERFLNNYLGSMNVMVLLFTGQIYFIIIKCIYVNLYKSRRLQRVYFVKLVATIVIGVILNIVCFYFCRKKEAFAVGTLLSAIIWFLLCQNDFPDLKMSLHQYMFIVFETMLFLGCGLYLSAIQGFCVYVMGSIAIILLIMRTPFFELIEILRGLIQK